MNSIASEFGLTAKQTALLFSIEYYITLSDIISAIINGGSGWIFKNDDSKLRGEWLETWEKNTNNYIKSLPGGAQFRVLELKEEIAQLADEVEHESPVRTPMYLILLECILFKPYYPINTQELGDKKLKSIKFMSSDLKSTYEEIAHILHIHPDYIEKFQNAYSSAINGLTGKWVKLFVGSAIGVLLLAITAGAASSLIAPFFAASGLYGAAAVASGLAALGGGAIAAGGFGMAGGIAVLIGGGALLGGAAGSSVGLMLAASPDLALSQAARLEVALKEIVIGIQNDYKMLQEILHKQNEMIFTLKIELKNEKASASKDKERIKNMEKAIGILEKAYKRNEGI